MHSQQPPGVVQNWSTLQCSKQNTEQCGYDHAPVTRGRMRAQFPLPHGPPPVDKHLPGMPVAHDGSGLLPICPMCSRSLLRFCIAVRLPSVWGSILVRAPHRCAPASLPSIANVHSVRFR